MNPVEEDRPAPAGGEPARSSVAAKAAISVSIGGVFAFLLWKGALPIVPTRTALERLNWVYMSLATATWLVGHVLRAARWHFLLVPMKKVSLRVLLPVSFAGFAAVVGLPLRMGEAVRPLMIGRATGVSAWAIAGAVAAERVMDGLSLSVLLFFGLIVARPIEPLPDHIGALPVSTGLLPQATYTALAVFSLAFVAIWAFRARREWARRATEAVIGVVSAKLARMIADKIASVADGLEVVASASVLLPFAAVTTAYWLAGAEAIWLLGQAAGVSGTTFAEALVVLGTLSLGILVPAGPGYFGAFQISVYAAIARYHHASEVVEIGATFVFLLYVLQVGGQLLIGAVSLLAGAGASPRANAKKNAARAPA
jgi:uncharacterized protein (TIRG00374 family)